MMQMTESKTVVGLGVLLLVIIGLSLTDHLTQEAVEAIKWVGGTYFGVRAVANYAENKAAMSAPVAEKEDK